MDNEKLIKFDTVQFPSEELRAPFHSYPQQNSFCLLHEFSTD
jgi:hypothetical protein